MPNAMTALATLTLGSAQATVTFSSISGAYRDLRLVITGGITFGSNTSMRVNGDTGSNYSWVTLEGSGSAASSGTSSGTQMAFRQVNIINSNGTPVTQYSIDILDYSATDKHKSMLFRTDNSAKATIASAGRWASTSAITSISLFASGDTWTAGSTFTLFGVSA